MKFLFVAILAIFTSCGNGKRIVLERSNTLVSGSNLSLVSGSCLLNSNQNLTGTCRLVSEQGLGQVDSGKSISVSFRLEEGGSVVIHAFSQDALGGLDLMWERRGKSIKVTATIAGQTTDYSSKFISVDASGEMTFQVDVHNDEEPVHLVIWPGAAGPGFALASSWVNSVCSRNGSTDCHNWGTARGEGSELAITLVDASLGSLVISDAKYQE